MLNSLSKKISIVIVTLIMVLTSIIGIPTSEVEGKSNNHIKNLVKNKNMKSRIIWYNLVSNIDNLNTPEKVANIVAKTAKANFNGIVLDVKGTEGFVGYPSEFSPHLSESNNPNYQNFPEGYDIIEQVISEAKKYDIEVSLNISTFTAGNIPYNEGPAIENPDWQTVVYEAARYIVDDDGNEHIIDGFDATRYQNQLVIYTPENNKVSPANRWGIEAIVEDGMITEFVDGIIVGEQEVPVPENGFVISAVGEARQWVIDNFEIGDHVKIVNSDPELKRIGETNATAAFMNPIHPEVQQYTWNIIQELVENYDIDGITLDHARYNNVYTDFSDLSREKFEEIGESIQNWPEDIYTIEYDGNEEQIVPGPYYKEWIKWRAQNVETFFENTRELVKSINPDVYFNTYVGSWHPLYYNEGVNWASEDYIPDYDWAAEDYHETGYADELDFLMTGLYYGDVTIEQSDEKGLPYWYSVEGAADISMEATQYDIFTYGSLFLLQYKDRPKALLEAIKMTENKMHGIMIFDVVYLEMYDWWWVMEEAFKEKTKAPHSVPGLLR